MPPKSTLAGHPTSLSPTQDGSLDLDLSDANARRFGSFVGALQASTMTPQCTRSALSLLSE